MGYFLANITISLISFTYIFWTDNKHWFPNKPVCSTTCVFLTRSLEELLNPCVEVVGANSNVRLRSSTSSPCVCVHLGRNNTLESSTILNCEVLLLKLKKFYLLCMQKGHQKYVWLWSLNWTSTTELWNREKAGYANDWQS